MASPPTVDFDALLAPISDDQPAGVALRGEEGTAKEYLAVYDARKDARSAERQNAEAEVAGEDGVRGAVTPPDWKIVVRLATEVLTKQSKDLWVAAWLVEGLTRVHGFPGVRDGFRVVRELSERYFDTIHPRPDEEGVITTVAQLAGLNGEGADGALVRPINAIEITQGSSVGPFSGRDYADAESLAKTTDPDLRAQRMARGMPTLDMIEVAARETMPEFFANLREDITAAIDEFDRMNAVLKDKCGDDDRGYSQAPPSSQISEVLAESLTRVRALAGEPEPEPEAEAADAGGAAAGGSSGGGVSASGNIMGREDAFKTLMKVAEFFRRTEPHSPVSYALEQAVRWGRMPLPDLIKDLVSDDTVRREFFRRTGIKPDSNDD
jgi:type VI secretion system protein ImpA